MNLNPVQDFVKSEHVRGWLDRVAAPQFQEAVKAAMLEYSKRLTGSPTAGERLAGAHDFLATLMSLGESSPTPQRKDTINLSQHIK
jgi:hypothetical protein